MYEFHYDYIKNKYDNKSKLVFTDTDYLIHQIKTEDVYEGLRKCLISVIVQLSQKYYVNSNTLVIGKMKDETGDVAIEEFVGLNPKLHSFLVDNSEHKKVKSVNKNVFATISHNEHKDVLLNNKCIRHSMNRIQSKDHRI